MLNPIDRLIIASLIALGIAVCAVGCASTKSAGGAGEQRVTIAELSPPARATVEKVTSGGTVDQIDREFERGKVVYDVEATVTGKHVEYLIAHSDGEVLGTEITIDYNELPAAVRTAAEKYFRTSNGLKAMKGVEYGETHYEVEGPKNGKTVEATFDPQGKRTR